MEGTVSLVAIIMWAGALTLIGFAVRRRDDSLKMDCGSAAAIS